MTQIYPFLSYIGRYSTASSPDAAYIIGGYWSWNLVVEFRNDQWTNLENLNKGRYAHGSITVGTGTMIVGGHMEK